MYKKEFKFSDGTRIFYEKVNGKPQRWIEEPYTPEEKEQIKKNPQIESVIASNKRKYNAGKYYYLDILHNITCELNEKQKCQLYEDLKKLHDRIGKEDDDSIVNKDFLQVFGKYQPNKKVQCAAFFVTIYLAMRDMEERKTSYPNSLGKTMVLKSCEAVVLKNVAPKVAAVMFEKRKRIMQENCNGEEDNVRLEKNGYIPQVEWMEREFAEAADIAYEGHSRLGLGLE